MASSSNEPDLVRVGVVTWQSAGMLGACLAALPAAMGSRPHEVVVVDNASTDGSADVAAGRGATVVRNTANHGYAAAMDQALSHDDRGAAWLVALNPDTVPAPGSLARLVEVLERHADVAVAAPLLRHPDGAVQHSAHRFPMLRVAALTALVPRRLQPAWLRDRWWLDGAVRPDRCGRVDWTIGAVHVLRRSAVTTRPYDPRWFLYVEDLDLCWRMRRHGWRTWFAGDVEVHHVGDVSGRVAHDGGSRLRWLAESHAWIAEVRGGAVARLYALALLVGEARVRARRRRPGRGWRTPSMRLHAAVVRRGAPPPRGEA